MTSESAPGLFSIIVSVQANIKTYNTNYTVNVKPNLPTSLTRRLGLFLQLIEKAI